jgi:hypothetical protein
MDKLKSSGPNRRKLKKTRMSAAGTRNVQRTGPATISGRKNTPKRISIEGYPHNTLKN